MLAMKKMNRFKDIFKKNHSSSRKINYLPIEVFWVFNNEIKIKRLIFMILHNFKSIYFNKNLNIFHLRKPS